MPIPFINLIVSAYVMDKWLLIMMNMWR